MEPSVAAAVQTQSSDFWWYVIVGYVATIAVLLGYAIRTILRGRQLSRQVPPENRRWL